MKPKGPPHQKKKKSATNSTAFLLWPMCETSKFLVALNLGPTCNLIKGKLWYSKVLLIWYWTLNHLNVIIFYIWLLLSKFKLWIEFTYKAFVPDEILEHQGVTPAQIQILIFFLFVPQTQPETQEHTFPPLLSKRFSFFFLSANAHNTT